MISARPPNAATAVTNNDIFISALSTVFMFLVQSGNRNAGVICLPRGRARVNYALKWRPRSWRRVEDKKIKRSLPATESALAWRRLAEFRKEQRQIDCSKAS